MNTEALKRNFEKHGFSTQFFASKEEARDYLVETLHRRSIGFGGSATLVEMNLYDALSENNAVTWHQRYPAREIRDMANSARVYIASANGVAETGQIVNIDGTGNRVAMTSYGPEICYYIIGKNKIVPSLAEALERSKNVAGPKNAQRIQAKTPCAKMGDRCYDCDAPGRICRMTLIVDRAPLGMDCEILFVNEDLGY